jgi:RNA polymerase sigma-70 factor (ECF subfamily)
MASRDDDVDDILQDTMLEIVRSIGGFRGDSSFLTWAATVARSQANRHRRRRQRFMTRDGAIHAVTCTLPDYFSGEVGDPERAAIGVQAQSRLNAALEHIAPLDRAVLVLRELQGYTTGETAEHLGLSTAAVKSRLHRARIQLRASLERAQARSGPHLRAPRLELGGVVSSVRKPASRPRV